MILLEESRESMSSQRKIWNGGAEEHVAGSATIYAVERHCPSREAAEYCLRFPIEVFVPDATMRTSTGCSGTPASHQCTRLSSNDSSGPTNSDSEEYCTDSGRSGRNDDPDLDFRGDLG